MKVYQVGKETKYKHNVYAHWEAWKTLNFIGEPASVSQQ